MNEKNKEMPFISTEEEVWEEELYRSEEDPTRFIIDDIYKADWAMRKIKAAKEVIEQAEEFATTQKAKIDEWLKKETENPQYTIHYMEYLLTGYYRELRAEDPKAKLTTPNGKVTSRKQQPKWSFNDEKMIEYLKENKPELVQEVTDFKYNKIELKKEFTVIENENGELLAVDENGEFLDEIVTVEKQEETYKINVE